MSDVGLDHIRQYVTYHPEASPLRGVVLQGLA